MAPPSLHTHAKNVYKASTTPITFSGKQSLKIKVSNGVRNCCSRFLQDILSSIRRIPLEDCQQKYRDHRIVFIELHGQEGEAGLV
jgi:hypothetical protein